MPARMTRIDEVSTVGTAETDPFVTADGHHLYFARTDAGGIGVLYEAVR